MGEHTRMLLGLRPDYALVRMMNDENVRKYPADLFVCENPQSLGGTLTKVRMRAQYVYMDDNYMLPHHGHVDFTYHRVDLTEQFQAILAGFRPPLPSSTQVLLNEITRLTGIRFYPEDIVLDDITRTNAAPYVIRAKAESLRFVGEIAINVLDAYDLSLYLNDGLEQFNYQLSTKPQLRSFEINTPFLNATPQIETGLVGLFEDNAWRVNLNNLGTLLTKTVPFPGRRVDQAPAPWNRNSVPGPFNYSEASVDVLSQIPSPNRLIPKLNRALQVNFNENYLTNFDSYQVTIPYYHFSDEQSLFTTRARLRLPGVAGLTDASAWARQIYLWQVSDIIVDPGADFEPFAIMPNENWNFYPDPNRTNLRNCVVQYNGEIGPFVPQPLNPALNRVVVVTLSDLNTTYEGNFRIYYRAPINLNLDIPEQIEGEATIHDFAPTDSQGPYTLYLEAGELAAGHTIDETSCELIGTPSETGVFSGTLRVQDAMGYDVTHSFSYRVV